MIDGKAFFLGWRIGLVIKELRSISLYVHDAPEMPEEPEESDKRYDVIFEDGILYIRKAPSVMVYGDELSFTVWDLENEEG